MHLQPHDKGELCCAAGLPITVIWLSPDTMVETHLCFGQVALSPTHATGFPSIVKVDCAEITVPPPVVGEPKVIYGSAMCRSSYFYSINDC